MQLHKILIIEDEETIRNYISILLGTFGYETITAESAHKGLELAALSMPDVILMDIMMPGMDGIEACKRLKSEKALKNIPVIMATAKTDDATMERAFKAGVFDYVAKPFNKLEVKTRIKAALNYKKLDEIRRQKDLDLEKRVEERTLELADVNKKLQTEIAKKVEREIRLSLLEKALETIDLGVTIADMEGTIIYSNPAEAKMHGYTVKELTNKNISVFAPASSRQPLTGKVLSEENSKQRETINLKKDGSHFPVYLISNIVVDNQKKPVAVITACKDITLRRKLEEERKKLELQLLHSQKLETIGTLAGGIAHDFNNILTPILTFAEVAMLEVEDKSDLRHYLSIIYSAGERARDLISHILAFSRQAELEMQAIQPKYIVREALKLISRTLPATIEITRHIRSDITVMADPSQLHQVIMNLCTNAFHAMEKDGGLLTVSLKDMDIDIESSSRYPGLSLGKYVKLSVSDTGEGMTRKVMDKIFDPFFTTKATGKGTGMGLSVVHGIVKSHGGLVTVESEPGKGTIFTVYLPQTKEAKEIKAKKLKKVWSGNVLIVDDDTVVAESIKMLLKIMGFTAITTTTDSIEALKLFKKHPDKFDLVITDMIMPLMTGDILSEKILEIRPDMPIIMCSGFSEHIDEGKAKKLGIKAFIMKPVLRNSLEDAIEKSLDISYCKDNHDYQI